MTLRLALMTAAASLVVFGNPADAQPQAAQADSEAVRQAEQAADQAVAEARAEVAAEARAEVAAQAQDDDSTAPVTISDVSEGSAVHDTAGGLVGTVESVDDTGAIVSTGRVRAKLPFSSFGRNRNGLIISLTRAQLEAEAQAAAARTPS